MKMCRSLSLTGQTFLDYLIPHASTLRVLQGAILLMGLTAQQDRWTT
jgi:hypothetical protein